MYNSRSSIGSTARKTNAFKISLGNTGVRPTQQIASERKTFVSSPVCNSVQVPQWMARTQSFYKRSTSRPPIFANPQSPFHSVKQTDTYAHLRRISNTQGAFLTTIKSLPRTTDDLKKHTFHFQWPKPQSQLNFTNKIPLQSFKSETHKQLMFHLPKYGLRQTPLHRQKDTVIKIGHPYLMNSTYIK